MFNSYNPAQLQGKSHDLTPDFLTYTVTIFGRYKTGRKNVSHNTPNVFTTVYIP